jgi:hypothetical protein
VQLNFTCQLEPGDAAEVLAQDFFFDLELMFVACVLVVASAAAAEVWTRGRNAVRRRLDDCRGVSAGEAGLFFGDGSFDFFFGENKGNEDSLTASTVVGRKASESVAAIDQLFNV